MERIELWARSLWADFLGMTPAEQASWVFGALAVLGPAAYGLVRLLTRRRPTPEPSRVAAPDVMDRLVKLVADGKATVHEAADLARIMMVQTAVNTQPALGLAAIGANLGGPGMGSPDGAGGAPADSAEGENRRQFVKVVQALATSQSADERAVVLKYAKGDVAAAFAALEKRAQSAGPKGAPLWRELAALARPRDPQKAIFALEKATALEPKDAESHAHLAQIFAASGRADDALSRAGEAVTFAQTPLVTCNAKLALAAAHAAKGDTAAARAAAAEAVEGGKAAAAADPASVDAARALARAFSAEARFAMDQGDVFAARASAECAVDILSAILADDRQDTEAVADLANAHCNLAVLANGAGDVSGSIAILENARALVGPYVEKDRGDLALARQMMHATSLLAWRKADFEDEEAALTLSGAAIEQAERLLGQDPGNSKVFNYLTWAQILRARLMTARGESGVALEGLERAVTRARARALGGDLSAKETLFNVILAWADLRTQVGDVEGARALVDECYASAKSASDADPSNVQRLESLGLAVQYLRDSAENRGDWAALDSLMAQEVELRRRVVAMGPRHTVRALLASSLYAAASVEGSAGRPAGALRFGEECHDLAEALLSAQPQSPVALVDTIHVKTYLGGTWQWIGDVARADLLVGEAWERTQKALASFPQMRSVRDAVLSVKAAIASLRAQEGRYGEAADLRCDIAKERADRHAADPTNQDALRAASDAATKASYALSAAGDYVGAEQQTRRAVEWARTLKEPELPANRETLRDALQALAHQLKSRGDAQAQPLTEEVEALDKKINVRARHTLPVEAFEAAVAECEKAAQAKDFDAAAAALDKARALAAEAFADRPQHPLNHTWRARVLQAENILWGNQGKIDEVMGRHEELITVARTALERDPRNAGKRVALMDRLLQSATVLGARDAARQLALTREALTIAETLFALSPRALEAGVRVAICRDRLSSLLISRGALAEARTLAEENLAFAKDQASQRPDQRFLRRNRAAAHKVLADVLGGLGMNAEALAQQREAFAEYMALADTETDQAQAASYRQSADEFLTLALFNAGLYEEGAAAAAAAITRLQPRWETATDREKMRLRIAILLHQTRLPEANADGAALIPIYLDLEKALQERDGHYSDPVLRDYYLTRASDHLTSAAIAAGDLALAASRFTPWAAACQAYAAANPSPANRLLLAQVESTRAELALAEGRRDDAVAACDGALAIFAASRLEAPDDASVKWAEAETLCRRALALDDGAAKAEAAARWRALKAACGGVAPPYSSPVLIDRAVASWA